MRQKTQKQFLQKNIVVFVLAIVCCLLWGSAFPVVKLGYAAFAISSGDTASQILFAGLRFALAGALAILIGSVLKKRFLLPQKASLPSIGKLALVQTIAQYLFFYIGLANTTAVKSAIIGGTSSFLAILICLLYTSCSSDACCIHAARFSTSRSVSSKGSTPAAVIAAYSPRENPAAAPGRIPADFKASYAAASTVKTAGCVLIEMCIRDRQQLQDQRSVHLLDALKVLSCIFHRSPSFSRSVKIFYL